MTHSTPDPNASTRRENLPPRFGDGRSPEQRRVVARCLWVLGVLSASTLTGVGASLYLANNWPLLLIALSPLGRHLILVVPIVDPIAFLAVAVSRRAAFSITCFYLGRAMGPAALVWLESRAPRAGQAIRWLERLFRRAKKASFALVFFLPGAMMSTIAGEVGMRSAVYIPTVVAGLVFRMLITLWIGDWLREPIEIVLGWIDRYWVPGTVVLVGGIAVYQWRKKARAARPGGAAGLSE